ncbi:MAG TPA: aspartate kinase [Gammaproteobacteria bacterium]|nr:aspartate kinase [Gammaproteobacteria bacterium]
MSLIVQKYGGSSVADPDHIRRVARRIRRARDAGHEVVAVVSAMGDTTSELLDRAQTLSQNPTPRELDMLLSAGERIAMSLLAMALGEAGVDAISLTGPQAGIHTDETHFNAKIARVEPKRVRAELERGRTVIVAGYQGLTPRGEVATLGRGGSDTTAVALAAALGAERCEICSDVDGIYTADPRVVTSAKRIERMAYEDMLALARHGARVLNARAVGYALRTATPVFSVSSFRDGGGTLVHHRRRRPGRAIGIASHPGLLRIEWNAAAERETLARALEVLDVREPFHYRASPARATHELMIPVEQLAEPAACGEQMRRAFDTNVKIGNTLGSVSVVGPGLDRDESARQRFGAQVTRFQPAPVRRLAAPDALACILPEAALADATRALHREFIENAGREAA